MSIARSIAIAVVVVMVGGLRVVEGSGLVAVVDVVGAEMLAVEVDERGSVEPPVCPPPKHDTTSSPEAIAPTRLR